MEDFNDNQYYQYPPYGFAPMPVSHGSLGNQEQDTFVFSTVGVGPKGEKGDAAYFEDLTPAEKEEVYREVSFIGSQTIDAMFTTTLASTSNITIPIANFDEYDMLWVFVEGLMLAEGIDYAISDGKIHLTSPITHTGTKVLFRALRYKLPDGEKNLVIKRYVTENNTYNYNAAALTGTGVPTGNASYIGQLYIDTSADKTYVAKTTTGDWIEL